MCLLNSLHTSNFKRSVAFALQTDQMCSGGFEATGTATSATFALAVWPPSAPSLASPLYVTTIPSFL